MPKSDDFHKKTLHSSAPLIPSQDDAAGADLNATQIGIAQRKTAPQHTSRMPAPVMTKPKKKGKKNKTAQGSAPSF